MPSTGAIEAISIDSLSYLLILDSLKGDGIEGRQVQIYGAGKPKWVLVDLIKIVGDAEGL